MQLISRKNFIGKPVKAVFSKLEGQGLFELLDGVYQTKKPFIGNEMPVKLDKSNGEFQESYFNFVYQPSYDKNENIDGILIHAVAVTEQVLARKKIEESEYRYRTLIHTSPTLIAIFKGENMIIEIANDSVLESWGKGKDIIGKPTIKMMPETAEQGFDKLLLSVYNILIVLLSSAAFFTIPKSLIPLKPLKPQEIRVSASNCKGCPPSQPIKSGNSIPKSL